jgi:CHAT domain
MMAAGQHERAADGPDSGRTAAGRPDQAGSPGDGEPDDGLRMELVRPLLASEDAGLVASGLFLTGLIHLRADNNDEAIEFLGRALDGGELNAAYPLGMLLAEAGRLDEAETAMRAAATLSRVARAASVFLARLALARDDVPGAVTAARAALRLAHETGGTDEPEEQTPLDPSDWFQLAAAFYEAGQHELSAECFEACAATADADLAEVAGRNAELLRSLPPDAAAAPAAGADLIFDAMLSAVDSGSTSLGQVLREIDLLPDGTVMSDPETGRWLARAHQLAQAGQWLEGFALARVVRAAWRRSQGEWTGRYAAAEHFVRFANSALQTLPHPQLYALAMDAAREMIDLASAHGDDGRRRNALWARASLHLDPYIGLQPLNDIEIAHRLWRESLGQQLPARQAEALRAEYGDLPSIDEALELAESDLAAAAGGQEQNSSAGIESRLAEVLLWRWKRAPADAAPELRARCEQHARKALAGTSPDEDPASTARLLNTLLGCGAQPDPAILSKLLDPSLDEWSLRRAPVEVVSLVQQLANILYETDPARGLSLLREARPILNEAPEPARLSCWLKELLLMAALAGARPPFGEGAISAVDDEADARLRGARMIAATFALTALDRPRDARRMLDRFERVAPVLAQLHADAVEYMRIVIAEMLLAAESERDPHQAAGQAVAMLDFFTRHRLPGHAANVMYQLSLLASTAPALPLILEALRTDGLRTASFLGERGTRQLIRIYHQAVATTYNSPEKSPETWLHLIQQFGGARFSAALAAGVSYRVPPGGQAILNQVRGLAKENPDAAGDSAGEEELLTAYVSGEAELAGDDAAGRLANLRHRFDWLANVDLGERAAEHAADRLYLDEVGSSVGSNTVVLHLLTLPNRDGSTIIIGTCLAGGTITIDGIESVFPGSAGGPSSLSALGSHVRTLRELVQRPGDGPLPVCVEAAAILEEDLARLVPAGCREALRQALGRGQDHLLIVPHGALHYYPLHLLGPTSAPLCASWKVSYVPTLAALGPRRAPSIFDASRSAMAAIGLSFEGRPDVAVKLPSAVGQAREIAALFGCEALAESDATKGRILNAMRTSRRVHLATHGRNSVTAPAFQSMLVAPSAAGHDGDIAAWELGQLDLRGLEIVTTAACETGLGRFDELDNLRGLPASLFLAGVQSIATTLWPVGAESSRTFFTTFYAHLKDGASRIDAFAAAQQETRRRSPEFRRWAGYTLSGAWT